MRNFHRVATGVDVQPALHAVMRHPELWNADTFRTTYPQTPFEEVDDILLRFPDTATASKETLALGGADEIWYPAAQVLLPAFQDIILNLMKWTRAYKLARVMVSRVKPGGKILAHADNIGEYVRVNDLARYHVVLQGLGGSLFHCGNETVQMGTGEVWWFNAHELHACENNSVDDRIHLLVDVRTLP